MRSLKKADLIPEIALQHGLDEKTTDEIVSCYWKELGNAVRELKHLNVLIQELGEMKICRTKLEYFQMGVERNMLKFEEGSPARQASELKLQRIADLIDMREQEYQKRNQTRERRDEYEKTKENLEIPGQDIGRTMV